MSEAEMWLFDHPVNRQRRARSAAVASGLWLWGAGRIDVPRAILEGWAAGDDPLCASLGREPRYPGDGRSGIAALEGPPGSAAWAETEQRWLAPAIDDLRAGRIEAVEISMGRLRARTRGRRRFWRRTRPWWEVLGESVGHG
jgi:hypothetical protein